MCTLRTEIVSEHCSDVWKCEDRDEFNRAKQKEWTTWLDKEAVELVKDRKEVPRSHILRARWVLINMEKTLKQRKFRKLCCCALGFQDPRLTTLPTSSPTLTSDGESAIFAVDCS